MAVGSTPRRPGASPSADGAPARSRHTRQRRAVRSMLERADIFLGARDLRDRLREVGEGVGLSTVYRIVHELAATGAVDVVTDENGECLYRLRPEGEHHHFILCRACGRGVEISSAALEAWLAEVADRHGFGELTHRLDVFGICDVCQSPTGLP